MDGPRGPLRGPGSKGSEGSACLWQAGSKGGGIALWAMSIKSALRDLLSVSYGMKSILRIGSLRSPPLSGCAGLLHGKACHTILRSLRFLTNRVPLPPLFRGQNKTPRNTLFINGSKVSTGCCAPACGGKVVAPATKGGMHFLARQGGCKVFFIRGRLL